MLRDRPGGGGGGYTRLIGMNHQMGSDFYNWIDYNRTAFSIELLEWVKGVSF